jgi:hypothetical protein
VMLQKPGAQDQEFEEAPRPAAALELLGTWGVPCCGVFFWGLGFGGLGFGLWGLGFGLWGLGFGVWGQGALLGRIAPKRSLCFARELEAQTAARLQGGESAGSRSREPREDRSPLGFESLGKFGIYQRVWGC